ncbi:MAG: hypothetical protein V9G12_14190 [Microthrixaceae bacterium]
MGRRDTSAHPETPVGTARRTSVTSSSVRRADRRRPTNHSEAASSRSPVVDLTVTTPSRPRTTAGSSAAGSARATVPPTVDRQRIWG